MLIDERLQHLTAEIRQSTRRHPHLFGIVAVGYRHEYRGLLALYQTHRLVDILALVGVKQMESEQAWSHLLSVRIEELGMWPRVGLVALATECRVNPVFVIPFILAPMTVGIVTHHLSCVEVAIVIHQPEHRHALLRVPDRVMCQYFGDALALYRVPTDVVTNPLYQGILLHVEHRPRHDVLWQDQRGHLRHGWTGWRWCVGEVLRILARDVILLCQPHQSILEGHAGAILHEKLYRVATPVTAKAFGDVTLG